MNLTIRFGAHRASIYNTTKTTKTMALTTTAKDHARESHTKKITGRQILRKILDEEFLDYQKLLDGEEVDPPSLPCRTSLLSGQPLPCRGRNAEAAGLTVMAPRTHGHQDMMTTPHAA
jgi:hypothetical protein